MGNSGGAVLFLYCALSLWVHSCMSGNPVCRLAKYSVPGMFQNGDIMIGGIFPVHRTDEFKDLPFTKEPAPLVCDKRFDLRSYKWIQAMMFAVDEINDSHELLPNVKLGYAVYDTCDSIAKALEGTFALVTGEDNYIPNYRCHLNSSLAAVIGESSSTISIAMARILGIYQYPQISYFSSIPILSDKQQFPSFLRTIPSDTFQSKAFAYLVKYFGWKWVGTLAEDIEYGTQGVQLFKEEVKKLGICIAFAEKIPVVYSRQKYVRIVETIKKSTAKAIVVFSGETNMIPLVEEIERQNVTGITWLASEAWSTTTYIANKEQYKYFEGALGFGIMKGNIPGFDKFIFKLQPLNAPHDIYLKEFWENVFGCTWSNQGTKPRCTGEESLLESNNTFLDMSELRITCNVYNAVYAIAHALHKLQSCQVGKGPFAKGACAKANDFEPWQLLHYVKKVQFIDKTGNEQYFDENGDIVPKYDILNWQTAADGSVVLKTVGRYDGSELGQELKIDEQAIIWNGKKKEPPVSVCSQSCPPGTRQSIQPGQPVCCFNCITCPDGEISNGTDFTNCIKCPADYWSNSKKDECVAREIEFLSFGELLGVVLTVFAVLGACLTFSVIGIFIKNMNTPIVRANNLELSFLLLFSLVLCFLCALTFIGEPTVELCILRRTGFAVSFALCISCILVKTIVVLLAFKMTVPNQNVMKHFRIVHQHMTVATATLIQIVICLAFMLSSPPSVWKNREAVIAKIILECHEGSELTLFCILGYIGFLAIIDFALAFLARNLPDNFNEAKFITFSLLVFVVVWISFIPGYISTKGKYLVAVEIFAILSSSFGLLACIFFPKCYIIMLRPELNTKNNLMGRPKKL
ncbi:extracellular calcium-sensing receptor-like [Polyodon spathula]|uniref:extracellular calcium-sensing receptor-like n=1 Tax=Polyodon spathula TaxID=7913 RepID=UPI001B7F6B4A|nr:extracellular calcium-sensing receptor-like [Polyodon spathula]